MGESAATLDSRDDPEGEMRGSIRAKRLVLCAAAIMVGVAHDLRAERNCPRIDDQVVIVHGGNPTAFSLAVSDLGEGTVSIFQHPLGGILQQAGSSPLDFVFVPQLDFNGTTTFTYRLIPPRGCGNGAMLGTVTIVGGYAGIAEEHTDTTAEGLVPPPERNPLASLLHAFGGGACGVGMTAMPILAVATMIASGRRARRGTP